MERVRLTGPNPPVGKDVTRREFIDFQIAYYEKYDVHEWAEFFKERKASFTEEELNMTRQEVEDAN